MILNPQQIAKREKHILVGLYLSKYDSLGLKELGFESFAEAFNVIGYALGAKPASIKNYRDEFDPLFPNHRKGWHKRKIREYCLRTFDEYKGLDFESFTGLIKSFFGYDENAWSETQSNGDQDESGSHFAKRLSPAWQRSNILSQFIPAFLNLKAMPWRTRRALGAATISGCRRRRERTF